MWVLGARATEPGTPSPELVLFLVQLKLSGPRPCPRSVLKANGGGREEVVGWEKVRASIGTEPGLTLGSTPPTPWGRACGGVEEGDSRKSLKGTSLT